MELISIIVPIYNKEKYINKNIISLINQSYSNVEIILIDDGSNDKSGKICREYQLKYENIKYIKINNSGVSAARNCGINNSRGKYITFIDGDDYIRNDMIEVLYQDIKEKRTDLSVCCIQDENNENNEIYKFPTKMNITVFDFLKSNPVIVHSCGNKLFNNDIIKKNGIKFVEQKHSCEDLNFVLKYISYIKSISIVNIPLYFYVRNIDSVTSAVKKTSTKDIEKSILDTIYVMDDFWLFNINKNHPNALLYKYRHECYRVWLALQNLYIKDIDINISYIIKVLYLKRSNLFRMGVVFNIKLIIRMIILMIIKPVYNKSNLLKGILNEKYKK